GSELLGLPPGPGAGSGPCPPVGGADPPEGGGESGQEGRGRAAGVGGWRRGVVSARRKDPESGLRHRCAPISLVASLPAGIERVPIDERPDDVFHPLAKRRVQATRRGAALADPSLLL